MTDMLEAVDFRTEIIKKYAKYSIQERNRVINNLISEILENNLPFDEIEEKKEEAKILAKTILRRKI